MAVTSLQPATLEIKAELGGGQLLHVLDDRPAFCLQQLALFRLLYDAHYGERTLYNMPRPG